MHIDRDHLHAGEVFDIEGESINAGDVLVTHHAREGVVIEVEEALTVALDTQLNDELIREGLAREVISRCQKLRKAAGLEISDRVTLTLCVDDEALINAVNAFEGEISSELLATHLELTSRDRGAKLLDDSEHTQYMSAEEMLFDEMICVASLIKA